MSFSRRSFLVGAGSGLSLLVLTACTDGKPVPTPTSSPSRSLAIPRPAGMLRSKWTTDPFSLGSHSFLAVGATPQHRDDLREPVIGRLFFAGEATSNDLPGTVLGAQNSGARAAGAVADAATAGERIAVIGAGAAGAEAARLLTLDGFNVVVIEARNRPGGRIDTRTSKSWPLSVELGAWRLGKATDAALLTRLASLGVETNPFTGTLLARPGASATTENTVGPTAVKTATDWAAAQAEDSSLKSSLDKSGAAKTAASSTIDGFAGTALLDQYLASLATTNGATDSRLSSWFGIDEDVHYDRLVMGGFDALITDALDGVKTSLSTAVVGVAYSDSGVSLKLGTGESLKVDRAVVTVPLGVLQQGSIAFEPLLPFSHRAAIQALGMGAVETVWLRFDKPFWSTDAAAWNLVGTDDDFTSWINLEAVTGEPVLVGIVGGDAARRVAKLSDDQVIDSALRALVPFAGSAQPASQ
ncbi:FAD-dependent oxidoreductase [Lacisediminihabitans sp.]|uniref:flavin monoamine oxidase family protein n=1 Tax=Lacisediminihabitans sp. TaxID=2787631 RepID=UPI00374D7EF4